MFSSSRTIMVSDTLALSPGLVASAEALEEEDLTQSHKGAKGELKIGAETPRSGAGSSFELQMTDLRSNVTSAHLRLCGFA